MKKPAAKQTAVAKQAKPAHGAKPAPAKASKTQAGTAKHAAKTSGGKHPAKTAAKPKHAAAGTKKRQLALDGLAACSAQALATSLRLAGGTVTADDVEQLYWLTATDPDAGASILATLEAAQAFGVAGHRPAVGGGGPVLLGLQLAAGPHTVVDDGRAWWSWGARFDPADFPGAVVEEAFEVTW